MNEIYGAIVGDILGSKYEHRDPLVKFDDPRSIKLFQDDVFFTDDTVLTIAIMDMLNNKSDNFETYFRRWIRRYPRAGYSTRIRNIFIKQDSLSNIDRLGFGNGAAMRISPLAYARPDLADASIRVTHDSTEVMEGAMEAFWFIQNAKRMSNTELISLSKYRDFFMNTSLDKERPNHGFEVFCIPTVKIAILCFLEANSFKETIQNAISMGGDVDTIAAIAGSIASARWGIEHHIITFIKQCLTLEMIETIEQFQKSL
jgi:ADP-ribosylglycohydrolase